MRRRHRRHLPKGRTPYRSPEQRWFGNEGKRTGAKGSLLDINRRGGYFLWDGEKAIPVQIYDEDARKRKWGEQNVPELSVQAVDKETVLVMLSLIVVSKQVLTVPKGEHPFPQRLHPARMEDQFFDLLVCLPDLLCFDLSQKVGRRGIDVKIGKERLEADQPEFILNRVLCCLCCLCIGKHEIRCIIAVEKSPEPVQVAV